MKPPIHELDFISQIRNHQELASKLRVLVDVRSADLISAQALYVGLKWVKLGDSHLKEAKMARKAKITRACYSKAYYSVYNYSKGIRYLVRGSVSLKGDDHQSASELPDDFPDRDAMSKVVTDLYACRLRADYDNWDSLQRQSYPLKVDDAVRFAVLFSKNARSYIVRRYGEVI